MAGAVSTKEENRTIKSPRFAGLLGARSAGLEPATFSVRSWTESMSASVAYIHETPLPSQILAFCRG
jgi:hypothetical protein